MAIIYDPNKMIDSLLPDSRIKKLVDSDLNFKRKALVFLKQFKYIKTSDISQLVLMVIRDYKSNAAISASSTESVIGEYARNPKRLAQVVQNAVVWRTTQQIQKKYKGQKYRWLPSSATEPDPLHQLRYGKIYIVGRGEMPQDRYGCKCGMELLVDETELNL